MSSEVQSQIPNSSVGSNTQEQCSTLLSLPGEILSQILVNALDSSLAGVSRRGRTRRDYWNALKPVIDDLLTTCKDFNRIIKHELLRKSSYMILNHINLKHMIDSYWFKGINVDTSKTQGWKDRDRISNRRKETAIADKSHSHWSLNEIYQLRNLACFQKRIAIITERDSAAQFQCLRRYSQLDTPPIIFNDAKTVVLHDSGASEQDLRACAGLVESAFHHQTPGFTMYLKREGDSAFVPQKLSQVTSEYGSIEYMFVPREDGVVESKDDEESEESKQSKGSAWNLASWMGILSSLGDGLSSKEIAKKGEGVQSVDYNRS